MQWVIDAFPDLQQITPLMQGGQKIVFTAVHPQEKDIVLKLIRPTEAPEGVGREILAVNQVGSSRVPRILDVGTVDTPMGRSVWITEQRLFGIPLRERLHQGPLNTAEVLKLLLHILEALVAAENVKIVHRDVKPENIFIDTNGDYWLLDFGIARHLTMSPLTTVSSPFGKFTLGYAPPEQFRNVQSDIDSRADLFALGVTAYECALGRHPFIAGSSTPLETLRRVESVPLSPLTIPCKASSSLSDLLNSMTQKRRDNRPPTVSEALKWLKEILDEEAK